MLSRIKRNIDTLRVLKKASPKLRKAIISNSDTDLVLALCEIIINVLSGTVKLQSKEKRSLSRHRTVIRKLADKSVPAREKKKLLVQRGGFLTTLLVPALTLLGTLIGNAARS